MIWEELNELLYEPCDPDGQLLDATEGGLESLTVSERWLKSDLAFHVHLRVRSCCGEPQAHDLCLAFVKEGVEGYSVLQEMRGGVPSDGVSDRLYRRINELPVKGAVLVNVGKQTERGQVVLFRYPSAVWLLPLDECPCFSVGRDAMKGAWTPLGRPNIAVEGVALGVDGERVPAVGSVAFGQNELPNEMIQCRTQVVNGVAANDAETQRYGFLDHWAKAHDVPRSIEPVIDEFGLGVRFKEDAKFTVERVEVLISPSDLESDGV
jgi:hypothetical protein